MKLEEEMKKKFAVLIVVIMLLSTAVYAEDILDSGENDLLASFSVVPSYEDGYMLIKLIDLSDESGLSFSYDPGTGFLHGWDGSYGADIMELEDDIAFDESGISIGKASGEAVAFPYSFRLFIYMYAREPAASGETELLDPAAYYEGQATVYAEVEATLEQTSDRLRLVLRKTGTSNQAVNEANIGDYLSSNLLLVNRSNTLRNDYIPSGLVYGKPARGKTTVNLRLEGEAMDNLNSMLEAAYSEGISGMVITSAFRTFEKQTSLFNNKTNLLSRKMNRRTAMEEASKIVALPGSSEHQTGLAADVCSESVGLIRNFGSTSQGKWMEDNSWRFGLIIRYPMEKTDITGIIYEPWHVRYIGSGHSELVKSRNLCLEEYVEYLKDNRLIYFEGSRGDRYVIRYLDKEEFNSTGGLLLSLKEGSTWDISKCTEDSYVLTIKL